MNNPQARVGIFFENFFLEVLWVIDETEIRSELTSKTKLWERSQFNKNNFSPFGLCLVNSKMTDKLFEQSQIYQPNYFPKGMSIDIITKHLGVRPSRTFEEKDHGCRSAARSPFQGCHEIP